MNALRLRLITHPTSPRIKPLLPHDNVQDYGTPVLGDIAGERVRHRQRGQIAAHHRVFASCVSVVAGVSCLRFIMLLEKQQLEW